jgi:hypothetical protein
MNYTERYHLPQWEETDRIMRTDFNQMCVDMEAGLNKTASDAAAETASGVKSASDAASRAASAAVQAQKTADSALSKANAAFSSSNFPYVLGTYVGNGSTLTVSLGFTPRFVIVAHQITADYSGSSWPTGFAMAGMGVDAQGLTVGNGSFTVSLLHSGNRVIAPQINLNGTTYAYIAFR